MLRQRHHPLGADERSKHPSPAHPDAPADERRPAAPPPAIPVPSPLTSSVADVARLLQVSQGTVRQLTHGGQLSRLPIRRPWRYSAAEIRRFLAAEEPPPSRAMPPWPAGRRGGAG